MKARFKRGWTAEELKAVSRKGKAIPIKKCDATQEAPKEAAQESEKVCAKEAEFSNAFKLSIIIPVYNAAKTLKKALDSVLVQSLKEIEVICADRGSSDNSLSILQEYEKSDARVKVLSLKGTTSGEAKNTALTSARGEYVHFFEASDYALPYAYEALYNKLVKYKLDVIHVSAIDWDLENECCVEVPQDSLSTLGPGDFNRLVGTEKNSPLYKVNPAAWAGIYKRSFLVDKSIRFNSLPCAEDRAFYSSVLTAAARTMISRDRLVCHAINRPSELAEQAENFACYFRSIEDIAARLANGAVDMEVQERVFNEEFDELLSRLDKLCTSAELKTSQPDIAERLIDQTSDFASSCKGPFAFVLRDKFSKELKKLKESMEHPAPSKSLQTVTPIHEASKHPKVSVVVPTYNVEDYLNEALHSLTSQTLEDIEFICVNDGATDGSLVIMKEYAALDKRFRILDGPNGGYGKAMNRGINAAKGEYLGILEPDDFVQKDMFEKLYAAAKESCADFVKSDFYRFTVNPDGSLKRKSFQLTHDVTLYNRPLRPIDEPDTFYFVMNTWSGIYKIDFLNKWHIRHNETPGASYQDNGFWFQTFCHADKAYFLNKPFYMNRRDNPNSSMYSKGKMYAVTNEYRFMRETLEKSSPELFKKVEKIYYTKKFHNFFVTLYRLSPNFQLEYLRHIKDEFKEPYERGLLDTTRIANSEWERFCEIMEDPESYYNRIRVSVIMPVYNVEPYLPQTLNGILARNEIQFEVICVDDGSTDNSLAILKEYEAKDPRVHVMTQENAGAGAARNTGLKVARGEYLSFLDADDVFEPSMIRLAYDRAKETDADVVVFRCDRFDDATGKVSSGAYAIHNKLLPQTQPFAGRDIKKDVFMAFVGWPWDKMFKASFVLENKLSFQEQRTTNDMLFVFSAVVKAERIATSNAVLAHHRAHGDSISATREKSWHCFYDALIALRAQLKSWGMYEEREQDFINYALHFTLWNITTIHGPAYHLLYDKLKTEWLAELGVTSHDMGYFYNRGEWNTLQQLLALDSEEFLFWRINAGTIAAKDSAARANSRIRRLTNNRNALSYRLSGFTTARVDVKNSGSAENDVKVLGASDNARTLDAPWLVDASGKGYVVLADAKGAHAEGMLSMKLKCAGSGKLQIILRGRDIRGEVGERVAYWLDFSNFNVNGEAIFSDTKPICHDDAYIYEKDVADGEIVSFGVAFKSHSVGAQVPTLDVINQLASLRLENEALKRQLSDIRSGMSFKLGRILTYIPRKILGRN